MKRLVFAALGVVFMVSAALQFNDPDPLYWLVAYGLAGVVTLWHAAGRAAGPVPWLALGLAVAGVLISAPGFFAWLGSGQSLLAAMGHGYVEQAREFLGLLLVSLALGATVWDRGDAG